MLWCWITYWTLFGWAVVSLFNHSRLCFDASNAVFVTWAISGAVIAGAAVAATVRMIGSM